MTQRNIAFILVCDASGAQRYAAQPKRPGSTGDSKVAYPNGNEDRDDRVQPSVAHVWMRGLIMLLLMFGVGLAQSVLCAVAVTQFLRMLIAGERNNFLARFGRSLGLWLAEAASFLSTDTEAKPFPWAPWPKS